MDLDKVKLAEIAPEDLAYTEAEVLEISSQLAGNSVSQIPEECSPAQARVALNNYGRVYVMTADIISTMLKNKSGIVH